MKRTDLALEAHQQVKTADPDLDGVRVTRLADDGIQITKVCVMSQEAAEKLDKPQGCYITLELENLFRSSGTGQQAARSLADQLSSLLPRDLDSVLVVGLGNAAVTPDAIGPRTLDHLLITRHLRSRLPDLFGGLVGCCAIAPGVLGSTGMESAALVRSALAACRCEAMIVVDALAACEEKRLCCTVQLSDAGIIPGSGIGNTRAALNASAMGIPVIAIGVPTVIRADVLRGDEEPSDLIVTPSDIDRRIRTMARILAAGINRALYPQLSEEEIAKLVEP